MEKHFNKKNLSLYTDDDSEYKNLNSYLSSNDIEHLLSPPYTPRLIALAKCRHQHIIETTGTLLHDHEASLPSNLWSFACRHAVYLINHMPTSLLDNESHFQKLFREQPNYKTLKTFDSRSYPWLQHIQKIS